MTRNPTLQIITSRLNKTCKVGGIDPLSGKYNEMEINASHERVFYWLRNDLRNIQDAFPDISSDEREFLLSGITPESWDNMFGDQ